MKYLILITLFLFGCTDAAFEKTTNFGNSAKVKCYSGGQVIYDGESSGKISSEQGSDGYYFRDKSTGKLIEISADCLFYYN